MSISTKIEMSFNRISRLEDLDELAEILFPGNKNHQRTFLAIFIELKYARGKFLSDLSFITRKYDISRRTLERVRAKMRRMGIIDHISRFNQKHGYREGWVLSSRFSRALHALADKMQIFKTKDDSKQRDKDLFVLGMIRKSEPKIERQSENSESADYNDI